MKILMIAGTTMRQIARDRTSLFFTIALPFVIILFIGLATSGFDDSEFTLGIIDRGSGDLRDELRSNIERSKLISLRSYRSEDDLYRDVRRGAVIGGVVVPRDYDARLRSGRSAEVVFASDPSRGFPAAIRSAVAAAVAEQGGRIQAAQFATEHGGGDFDRNLAVASRVQRTTPEIEVDSEEIGERGRRFVMSGFEYTAPSNFVLFVFITSLAGSSMLIESRRLGVTRRMVGTPTRARTILAGQALGRFGIAGAQGLYILGLGLVFFGVDFGNPLAAIVLALLFVLVATSFAMLFGTLFRTPEQAGSIGPTAGIAMGMLSGCMWPRFVMPEFMQHIGQLFPQAWAMDAWIKLVARGAAIGDILPELAVLSAFVVVLLPISAWRLRRSILAA